MYAGGKNGTPSKPTSNIHSKLNKPDKYSCLRYKKAVTQHLINKFRTKQSQQQACQSDSGNVQRVNTRFSYFATCPGCSRRYPVVPTVINPTCLNHNSVPSLLNPYKHKENFALILGNSHKSEGRVRSAKIRPRNKKGRWCHSKITSSVKMGTASTLTSLDCKAPHTVPAHQPDTAPAQQAALPTPMSPPPPRPPSCASSRASTSS